VGVKTITSVRVGFIVKEQLIRLSLKAVHVAQIIPPLVAVAAAAPLIEHDSQLAFEFNEDVLQNRITLQTIAHAERETETEREREIWKMCVMKTVSCFHSHMPRATARRRTAHKHKCTYF
jgi:hypothetical protein